MGAIKALQKKVVCLAIGEFNENKPLMRAAKRFDQDLEVKFYFEEAKLEVLRTQIKNKGAHNGK